jgi:pimeloyl-ACP methyl ester carboxylesterase
MPARVAGLALLGTAAPMRVADTLLAATRADPATAMDMINVWSHSPVLAPFAARPGSPAPGFNIVWQNLRLMQRVAAVNGADVLPTDFAACNAYTGAVDAIRELQCPVLFISGARDQMTPPRAARALIDACAQPQVITLDGTGHAMMGENPDAVRTALAGFAQRVFAAFAA